MLLVTDFAQSVTIFSHGQESNLDRIYGIDKIDTAAKRHKIHKKIIYILEY